MLGLSCDFVLSVDLAESGTKTMRPGLSSAMMPTRGNSWQKVVAHSVWAVAEIAIAYIKCQLSLFEE